MNKHPNRLSTSSRLQSQQGGTVLGFILGLLVGLLISLALAIYVTKVPIPFLNKAISRTAEQDAAEEKKNKDWDPNAPLYNKGSKSAQGASAAQANPSDKDEQKTDQSADKGTPSATDLIGDLIRSKSDAPAPSSAGAVDPFNYYVQAGAFRSNEEAESQRAKLVLQGYDPRISDKEQSGKMVYRVRIGPLPTKDEAEKVQLKLATQKIEAAIVRVQR
jgi:cell division protein FtsN